MAHSALGYFSLKKSSLLALPLPGSLSPQNHSYVTPLLPEGSVAVKQIFWPAAWTRCFLNHQTTWISAGLSLQILLWRMLVRALCSLINDYRSTVIFDSLMCTLNFNEVSQFVPMWLMGNWQCNKKAWFSQKIQENTLWACQKLCDEIDP